MSEELKPCPNPLCTKSLPFAAPLEILCLTCGTSGAIHVDREKAIASWNALPRTVQAAPSDENPVDPYSGELGTINLRNLAAQMHQALGLLKRQGCYHPAMGTMREEGFKHGLNLPDVSDHIGDTTEMVLAAPSDREKRMEAALFSAIGMLTLYTSPTDELAQAGIQSLHAALADTTNNDGG